MQEKIIMKKNKILIWVIMAVVVVSVFTVLVIYTVNTAKENEKQRGIEKEKQEMLLAMEHWAKGESYVCKLKDYPEIEEKAIEIVNNLKTKKDTENFSRFLSILENQKIYSQNLKNVVSAFTFSFEEKISLRVIPITFYTLPVVTKSEIDEYVLQNGSKELHFEKGTGGFYDGCIDNTVTNKIGISGSPLYKTTSRKHFGDFLLETVRGRELNYSTYKEEDYSYKQYYFKGKRINFDPLSFDCYYSDKYLFAVNSNEIFVHDTDAGRTVKFNR